MAPQIGVGPIPDSGAMRALRAPVSRHHLRKKQRYALHADAQPTLRGRYVSGASQRAPRVRSKSPAPPARFFVDKGVEMLRSDSAFGKSSLRASCCAEAIRCRSA